MEIQPAPLDLRVTRIGFIRTGEAADAAAAFGVGTAAVGAVGVNLRHADAVTIEVVFATDTLPILADVIERAARLFDRLIVSVGINRAKEPLLDAAQRIEALQRCVGHLSLAQQSRGNDSRASADVAGRSDERFLGASPFHVEGDPRAIEGRRVETKDEPKSVTWEARADGLVLHLFRVDYVFPY